MKGRNHGPEEGEIKLVPYRFEWEKQYAREKRNLENEIGVHILDIEHIGSTAVLEMSGQPVIDILIVLDDIADIAKFEDTLNQMGYQRTDQVAEPQQVIYQAGGRQAYNIHFVQARSLKGTSHPKFRDMLNADKKLAKEYKELKIRLARKYQFDQKRYSEEKGAWIRKALKASAGPFPAF